MIMKLTNMFERWARNQLGEFSRRTMDQCRAAVTASMDIFRACNDEINRLLQWLSQRVGHADARIDALERRVVDLEARLARTDMVLAEVLPWSMGRQ